MSFVKALQSFAFYLASCSPCNREMEKRRLKRDAKRQRQDKAREREEPHSVGGAVYEQPSAFSTNPYWLEEFNMGPHTNRKKNTAASKSASQRRLTSASGDTASVGGLSITTTTISNLANADLASNKPNSSHANSTTLFGHKESDEPNETGLTATTDLARSPMSSIGSPGSGSKVSMTYGIQELDEDSRAATSYSRGEMLEGFGANGYFDRKNPPVNDLHPPIVRQPSDRSASLWMMAPPPPAKVMEGRSRDRSSSWQSRPAQTSYSVV
ncbi:hypothetical protein GGS21DRAFT_388053 [Xylaria nigripes]|nr:hypothetical protein GGS21DRAFT_388053 [Xylaria nigripes]